MPALRSIHALRFAFVPALLVILACTRARAPVAPTLADFENLAIQGVYDSTVVLTGGVHEGTPIVPGAAARPRLELIRTSFLTHDLDGDGVAEGAAVLVESSGGSGVFNYLAIAARRGDRVRNVATAPLGDRVMIRSCQADSGAIIMEVVENGPNDPACCPTLRVRKTFRLDHDRLSTERVELGALSVADLSGTSWRLVEFEAGVPAYEDIATTANFEGDQISGMAGCNNYHARIKTAGGSALAIGPVVATRMACPEPAMSTEARYLGALATARQFSFVVGRLALTYQDSVSLGTLMFTESKK